MSLARHSIIVNNEDFPFGLITFCVQYLSELIVNTQSSIQGILWNIVDHILPCHTTQLATDYLDLTIADVQTIQERIRDNPRAVVYECLLRFIQKHNADEDTLYHNLKKAGVEQGLIPRVCLELCKGRLCMKDETIIVYDLRTQNLNFVAPIPEQVRTTTMHLSEVSGGTY